MNQDSAIDDVRSHCLEIIVEVGDHLRLLRDYAVTPGNSWLARNEMSKVMALMSDLETSIDAVKRAET